MPAFSIVRPHRSLVLLTLPLLACVAVAACADGNDAPDSKLAATNANDPSHQAGPGQNANGDGTGKNPDGSTGANPSDDSGTGTPDAGNDGTSTTPDGAGDGSTLGDGSILGRGCDTVNIYTISDSSDLYAFSPTTYASTKLGHLNCGTGSAHPNGLAMTRDGTAYVHYTNGHIYQVSVSTLACAVTPYAPNNDYPIVGMSTATVGGTDKIYVGDDGFYGLGTITPPAMTFTDVDGKGDGYSTFSQVPALAGTGAGKLYGFFHELPSSTAGGFYSYAHIWELNPTNGKATGSALVMFGESTGDTYTVAQWGGYLFTFNTQDGGNSQVHRVNFATGDWGTPVKQDTGYVAAAAGTPPCAPTTHP